jgi:hypothetical protein
MFGPGNENLGKFDVMHFKDGNVFVVRAIVYNQVFQGAISHSKWTMIHDGRSSTGVLDALEHLWTVTHNDNSAFLNRKISCNVTMR